MAGRDPFSRAPTESRRRPSSTSRWLPGGATDTVPGSRAVPSSANRERRCPPRPSSVGSSDDECSGMWITTQTAAGRAPGSARTIVTNGISAPADPPITTSGTRSPRDSTGLEWIPVGSAGRTTGARRLQACDGGPVTEERAEPGPGREWPEQPPKDEPREDEPRRDQAAEDQAAEDRADDDQPTEDQPAEAFPALVVVGASAGGIDALTELLGPLDTSFPAPIVVAQHTQPSRASHLLEIFAGRTKLDVVSVTRKEQLRPGTVYLVPSDHHVEITDHVVEAKKARGAHPSPSIDRLLATAADVFGERLIAVILSGMGSDGVIGAGEVKSRGGTVIIQNPETAAQPAMPRALPPTLVDFVANADRMAELLGELVVKPTIPVAEDEARLLAHFLDRVRERTGIDFSAYKRPTIMRRLQRRMLATASPRLRDYVRYTQSNPEEFQRLSSAFLIKVTQFFRDADLFDHLRSTLIPKLIEEARQRGRELRIWSAGCATGEEAYSLAILVAEALGPDLESFTVRIFATDLDDEAISFARRGVYPSSTVRSVGDEVLEKFFVRDGDQYE